MKLLKFSALALAAALSVGCANHSKETEARFAANEDAVAKAQLTAEAAVRKSEEALSAAYAAKDAADSASERSARMLDKASQK